MVTAEGLRPVKEVGMYGKIAVMELFRPKVRALGPPLCYLDAGEGGEAQERGLLRTAGFT